MIVDTQNYGPFAPAVGYAGTIMATGGAMFLMWGGKIKNWRPPDKDLPGTAQKMVLLLCGVFMVVEWYLSEPSLAGWMIAAVIVFAVGAVICYLKYDSLIGLYGYKKPVIGKNNKVEETLILGGRKLRPEAEEKCKEFGVKEQKLLEGAAFEVELLWDRNDLQWVRTRVLLFFILLLVMGTSALTTASFATQVILTKRAAVSVIHKDDAPGLR
jgi:hypothetical protein